MSKMCPKCKITYSDNHFKCPRCNSTLRDTNLKPPVAQGTVSKGQTTGSRMKLSELIEFHEAKVKVYLEKDNLTDDDFYKLAASKGIVIVLQFARRVKGADSGDPKYGLLPGETSGREIAVRLLKEHMEAGTNSLILQGAYQGAMDTVMGMNEEEWDQ